MQDKRSLPPLFVMFAVVGGVFGYGDVVLFGRSALAIEACSCRGYACPERPSVPMGLRQHWSQCRSSADRV